LYKKNINKKKLKMTKIFLPNFSKISILTVLFLLILPILIKSLSSEAFADPPAIVACSASPSGTRPSCGLCKNPGGNNYFTESECNDYYISRGMNSAMINANYNVSSNSFSRTICNALRIVTGTAGKTFAAFAIIAVGIGFFSGKVSWGLMIGVAAGIAAMFGAPSIVAAISGQSTDMACDIN
jgi:type IV secretory pathway VirB2 component (pilin)